MPRVVPHWKIINLIHYINEFLKSKTPSKEIIKIFINKIEIFENKNIKIHFNFNLDGVSNE